MAPGEPEDPVQNIDARDLTAWMIRLAEENVTGVFSATGHAMEIGTMLTEMRDALSSDATFTWVDADFLAEHEVQPWGHMTTWVPPRDGFEGFARVSIDRALAAGLEFRPLSDTTRDTLEWWNSLDEERRASPRAGLPAEREAEVLAAWHAREA
jgi:2'-hydroxyisoflavone reductase